MYRCVRKEKIHSDYDFRTYGERWNWKESLEADQENLKCLLAIGSQERTVGVIGSLSTLSLIWKWFDLD